MGANLDKLLFTPGPLTTSPTVKEAMLRDVGSRELEFLDEVAEIRTSLLRLAGVTKNGGYEAVPLQGSGTFGVEAAITTALPRNGRLLVLSNGAYGDRMARIATIAGIPVDHVRAPETLRIDPREVAGELERRTSVTHVAVVHCETSTGIINPVEEIGRACNAADRSCIVDSMSGFGALPINMNSAAVDFLVSSANKCIQGVPGFSFVLCRRDALLGCEGHSSSLSLDLYEQWRGLEQTDQFRFTPPTHAMLAFAQALRELEAEGGPEARGRRYAANQRRLVSGMRAIGFETVLPDDLQGCVITSFAFPDHDRFDFETFHRRLADIGFVIYPGKLSDVDCFRIGTAGHLFERDIDALLKATSTVTAEMGIESLTETRATSASQGCT